MNNLSREELKRLARLGAKARLEELRREEAAIRQAFPDLFGGGRERARGQQSPHASGTADGPRRRRRRPHHMSAAARQAASARMKKYWAERKAASAKK